MKNYKTSIIGAVYAALILILQAFTTNVGIDWMTVAQASIGILLGIKASDKFSLDVYNRLVLEWKTSLIGLATGIGTIVFAELQAGEKITILVVFKAVGVTLLGILSQDKNDNLKINSPSDNGVK